MTLRDWRKDQGLSQDDAAKGIGWTQSTWQRIESGVTPANADQLREVHAFTGGAVTPNDMVLGAAA